MAAGGAGAIAARWLPFPLHAAETVQAAPPARSRVVMVKHPGVLTSGYRVDREIFARMIDAGIRELTGAESDKAAWNRFAREGERVSMKYNTVGGRNLETHPETYQIIEERLTTHCAPERVVAWDRNTLPPDLDGWGSETYALPSRGLTTKLRAIVTDWTTCLINLPVVKMHWSTGITIAMKNHMGTNDNPGELHDWDTGMWKSIAELNDLPPIRGKTRLVVADATRPLWDGGPGDRPANRWDHHALLFAFDPVAVDAVGLKILEDKRAEVKGEPWPATYGRMNVEYAQEIGLGVADLSRIDLVEKVLA